MEDKYGYKVVSIGRILGLGTTFSSELTANVGLKGMFDKLQIFKDSADTSVLKLDTSTKAHTESGKAIREKAATDFGIVASIASAYGAGNSNDELKGLGRFTFSKLRYASVINQITDSKKIKQVITPHLLALADNGLDAALVTTINDDLSQLETLTQVPQNMIDAHKAEKIIFVNNLDTCQKFQEEQMDKTMQQYKIKNMAFYLAYLAARKVRHHHLKRKLILPDDETTTGTLETMLLFRDTMEPAAGASLVIALLNISETADAEGETYNDEIAPGTYHGKISMEGYNDIEFDFTIEAGKTCDLQFLLEKVEV
jgi:hypothetical protein